MLVAEQAKPRASPRNHMAVDVRVCPPRDMARLEWLVVHTLVVLGGG